ncbi:MAG: hypothetical protein ACO1NZ_11830 [Adhaeribacter sp.]
MLRLSTKQKREVYSLSSLLLHLIIFIVLLVALNSCSLIDRSEDATPACTTLATVKDMRGLDGCGFILVLDNGEKLEPVRTPVFFCGTGNYANSSKPSPSVWFDFKDGQKVKIAYEVLDRPSICMMGKPVQLTCITEVSPAPASPEPAI